jgi:hypothetical protein
VIFRAVEERRFNAAVPIPQIVAFRPGIRLDSPKAVGSPALAGCFTIQKVIAGISRRWLSRI